MPNIVVETQGGCILDVYGLPEGWTYSIVDWDDIEDEDHEEAARNEILEAGEK